MKAKRNLKGMKDKRNLKVKNMKLLHAVMDKGPAAYVVTAPLPSCYVFECSWAKGRMRGAFPIDLTGWLWSQLFHQIW
jgi:hypothetical protein